MHIHSFLPLVGFTLLTLAAAQDNSTQPDEIPGGIFMISNSTDSPSKRWAPPQSMRRAPAKRSIDGICDNLPSKWNYMGCFSDSPSLRVLSGPSYCEDRIGHDGMTQEKCIEFCDQKGYSVAGVEWGKECYCGYALDSSAAKTPETDCSKPCTGNGDEHCGEGGRINVFTNGDTGPAVLAASGDFNSIGCYSDSASARTLTTRVSLPGGVRVSDCTTACAAQGFQYAGLEFGQECYCGSSIQNGGHPIADKSCDMACTADKTQFCGGRGAINIYKSNLPAQGPSSVPDGWASKNCYSDSPSNRALSYKVPNFSKFSVAQCISECDELGYTIAGTEYGSECFCGNSLSSSSTQQSSGCDMACNGNKADTCGGAGRINIFRKTCAPTPGCHFMYGYIKTLSLDPHACQEACRADSNCMSTQQGDAGFQFCNLFSLPLPIPVASTHNTRCDSFSFYDRSCVL